MLAVVVAGLFGRLSFFSLSVSLENANTGPLNTKQ